MRIRPLPLVKLDPVEEGFLADIAEHPADDHLRLVYADWLEENTDRQRRAAYIRADVALADPANRSDPHFEPGSGTLTHGGAGVQPGCRFCAMTYQIFRTRELEKLSWLDLDRYPAGAGVVWDRGFVSEFAGTVQAWFKLGPRLTQLAPLETVRLNEVRPLRVQDRQRTNQWVAIRPTTDREVVVAVAGQTDAPHLEPHALPREIYRYHGTDDGEPEGGVDGLVLIYPDAKAAYDSIARMALRQARAARDALRRASTEMLRS